MKTAFYIFNGVMQAKIQNEDGNKVFYNILINEGYNKRKLHYL